MKIRKVKIENFGPYISNSEIEIDTKFNSKRVTLIGGKNGAGKTTLFNAIRIGLYGCRAFGFETENAKYLEIIQRMINNDIRISHTGYASITITIMMDDGKYNYQYQFQRMWKLNPKTIKEIVVIYRDGIELSDIEKSDFESYLFQLIPPDMFKFYFFDGEEISNFVINGASNTDFKESFLKLCGLDTMEIIYENFNRISSIRKNDNTGVCESYKNSKDELECLEKKRNLIEADRKAVLDKIIEIDEKLAKIEHDYVKNGGISKEEYQSLLSQINKEEIHREEIRKWLKDVANTVIPFVVLEKELSLLKKQILIEEEYESSEILRGTLSSKEAQNKLISTFDSVGIDFSEDLATKTIDVLVNYFTRKPGKQILNLSKQEQLAILADINNFQAFDKTRIKTAIYEIENSLKKTKEIRRKIEKCNISNSESYCEMKEDLLNKKNECLKDLANTEALIADLKNEIGDAQLKVNKAQQKYENYLRGKSVNDITAKALLAFSDLQKRLYKKYTLDLEKAFKKSFSSLINKSDLIDGIKIDEQLQVYPYKIRKFKRKELEEMIQQGEEHFINKLGSIAYETYLISDKEKKEIKIPIELKQIISAGEKQIFIMAIYQALSTLNKVSVPYIIDTPFARIDAEHRRNILNNFFMKLKGQIIILSTDEEIVGQYERCIKNAVSNYYLLQHNEDTSSTEIIKNAYFGGRKK